jgi:hypothetical protein
VQPSATRARPSGSASPVWFNRVTYQYSSTYSVSQEANLYQVMVLQSTDASKVPLLHAANPGLKIVVYQDAIYAKPSDPNGLTTCTDYAGDNANHPSWFLKDQYGNRLLAKGPSGNVIMDVGNPAYQQACLAHATALAKQSGFDGVYLDDLTAWAGWALPKGTRIAQYPTMGQWQAAMYSLISYAGPAAHAQGLLVVGNIGGTTIGSLWQTWTAPLDGSEEEYWTDNGSGGMDVAHWPGKLANAAWSEANGKYAILHSHGTTEQSNTYGLASMMLVSGGWASYSTSNANYGSSEAWYPEYATAQQLGAASGAYTKLANSVYERVFAGGIVLVNPTATAVPVFSLGGGIYSGSGLTNVTSVSLAPTQGLILQQVG